MQKILRTKSIEDVARVERTTHFVDRMFENKTNQVAGLSFSCRLFVEVNRSDVDLDSTGKQRTPITESALARDYFADEVGRCVLK